MNHASLFSGIGGAEVAASMMGWQNLFHCEIQEFPRKVLQYWFPNSESYEDITKTDFTKWHGKVDVLTGGFPCQPFSLAGRRKGADDNRYLWPQMLRAIRQIHPTWVVGENVAGIKTMVESCQVTQMGRTDHLFEENYLYREESRFTLDKICADLEAEGYSVQPIVIPACAIGAPHRRDRVWIVAHRSDPRAETVQQEGQDGICSDRPSPHTQCDGHSSQGYGNQRARAKKSKEGQDRPLLCLEDMAVAQLLPTPTALDKGGGRINKSLSPNAAERPTLALAARKGLLPTPCSIEATKFTKTINPNSQMGQGLTTLAVNGLLLTPSATDGLRSTMTMDSLKSHNKENANLAEQIAHKVGGGTSQLNPLFVEEMMGFPLMWTALPFLSPNGDKNP